MNIIKQAQIYKVKLNQIKIIFLNVLISVNGFMPSLAKIANQKSILIVRLISNNSGYKFLLQVVFSLIFELWGPFSF